MTDATVHRVTGDATQPIGTGTRVTVQLSSGGSAIPAGDIAVIVYRSADVYEAAIDTSSTEALERALLALRDWVQDRITPATVHMQRRDWDANEAIIKRALSGLEVFVYDARSK